MHAFKHIYAHGKGFIFTPKATSACTKTDFGAMEMLIVAPMIPSACIKAKCSFLEKPENHMNFGLVFLADVPLLSFSFVHIKKKNFGQVKLTAAYKLQHLLNC